LRKELVYHELSVLAAGEGAAIAGKE